MARVGLGCMRLSAEAFEPTVRAALEAGIDVFDTARAYEGNEAQLAAALKQDPSPLPKIITKGGMSRPAGAWVPDGRAIAIRRDCDASLAALGGWPIEWYLLHAP